MKLTEVDFDVVEELVKKMIAERVRLYDHYNFVILDDSTVIVKTFMKDPKTGVNQFTIKAKYNEKSGKLEPVEVS